MAAAERTWISPSASGPRAAPVASVDDPHVDPADRPADGVQPRGVQIVTGDDGHFAGPVRSHPRHAGTAGDGLGDARGDRRRTPHDVAQRRQVVRLETGVRGQCQRDRGDRHLDGDAVGFDVAQHGVDVETAVQPDPRPGVERRHDVEQTQDVRRRRHHLHAVGSGQLQRVAPLPHRRGQGPVGVPNRLGHSGGTRAEHVDGVRVGVERLARTDAPAGSVRRGAASAWTRRAPGGRRRRAWGRSAPAHDRPLPASTPGSAARPRRPATRSRAAPPRIPAGSTTSPRPATTAQRRAAAARRPSPRPGRRGHRGVYCRSSKASAVGSLTLRAPLLVESWMMLARGIPVVEENSILLISE